MPIFNVTFYVFAHLTIAYQRVKVDDYGHFIYTAKHTSLPNEMLL